MRAPALSRPAVSCLDSVCHHSVIYVLLSKGSRGSWVIGAADGAGPPHYPAGPPRGASWGPPPWSTHSFKVMRVPCRCPPHPLVHPPSWDSQRDLLSETPPLLPNLPLGPPHLCTMGLTRPAPWLSLLPHQQALQQQKLHPEQRPLVPCALGSRGLRKVKAVDRGGSAPLQGETQPRAASTQAWCEQTAPSAPMQQAQRPAESLERGIIHGVQSGHTAPLKFVKKRTQAEDASSKAGSPPTRGEPCLAGS